MVQLLYKREFFKILKMELRYDAAISLLDIKHERTDIQGLNYLHPHGHSSIIHNSQKMEATQVFISGRMELKIHGISIEWKKF